MEFNVFIIVYAVLQFIAFLLVVVGTPLDMFRVRGRLVPTQQACLTLWGFKDSCGDRSISRTLATFFNQCTEARNHFYVAATLAVISIFVYCAAFVLGVIMLYCCVYLRWVCLVLNIVGSVTLATSWVFVVLVFHQTDLSNCLLMRVSISFGVGFAVFLVAWVLELVSIAFLFIPWQYQDLDESSHSKKSNSQEE
ncbi:Amastin surface glycoprotein, putative [Leishmania lindenbergi]|uniref:Amastin surface glycoprotein n=1 Tax=Leishmania lindenbergi TaxID=651832 RepID=A0AAW3AXQ5_9TRYP